MAQHWVSYGRDQMASLTAKNDGDTAMGVGRAELWAALQRMRGACLGGLGNSRSPSVTSANMNRFRQEVKIIEQVRLFSLPPDQKLRALNYSLWHTF